MKLLRASGVLLLLASSAYGADGPKPCLILSQPHAWGWTYNSTRRMHYVAGEFPKGIKFRNNLSDKDVREIEAAGTKVIVLQPKYTMDDVEKARAQCSQANGATTPSGGSDGKSAVPGANPETK